MRNFIAVAVLLFSVSSFACPNLVGMYDCGEYKINIEMAVVDGVINYDINQVIYAADGKIVKTIDQSGVKQTKAECVGSTFKYSEDKVGTLDGWPIMSFFTYSYSLDNAGDLKHQIEGAVNLLGFEQPFDQILTCKPIP